MKKTITFITAILFYTLSFSQLIIPISATTNATNVNGSLEAAYNQNGIINSSSVSSNHNPPTLMNSFACSCTLPIFEFNLGTSTEVDGISLWNAGFNDSSIFTDDGVNLVKFHYSTDGVNYTPITGGEKAFTQNTDITSITDEITPETIVFEKVIATHIKMEVLSGFNTSFTSFAEIAFAKNGVLSTKLYENETFDLFPNPASNFIKINKIDKYNSYTIYNLLGKKVLNGNMNIEKEIDISILKKGLYFIKIDKLKPLKFIKK
jgi:hypothetical protein